MKWLSFILDFLFPECCQLCGKPLKNSEVLVCSSCFKSLPFLKIYCSRCGSPLDESLKAYLHSETVSYCGYCANKKLYFDKVFAPFAYNPPVSHWINKIKFGNDYSLGYKIGIFLRKLFEKKIPEVDLIIPLPLSLQRLRERGYNQSFLITWGYTGNFSAQKYLERILHTKPQTQFSQKERWKNVKNVFLATQEVKDKKILLIDDVMTTGATLNEASKALKKRGAKEVYVLVLAKSVLV